MCKECGTTHAVHARKTAGKAFHPKGRKSRKAAAIVNKTFGVPLIRHEYNGLMQGAYITRKGRHSEEHALIYKGDIANLPEDAIVTVRFNSACYTGDIFHDESCDCTWQLEESFRIIDQNDGFGLVLYHFAHEGKGFGYFKKLTAFDGKMYPVPGDIRDFAHAIAILQDLGIKRVRVMTNNPEKQKAITDAGIEIVEVVNVVSRDPKDRHLYEYKARVWGHEALRQVLPGAESSPLIGSAVEADGTLVVRPAESTTAVEAETQQ